MCTSWWIIALGNQMRTFVLWKFLCALGGHLFVLGCSWIWLPLWWLILSKKQSQSKVMEVIKRLVKSHLFVWSSLLRFGSVCPIRCALLSATTLFAPVDTWVKLPLPPFFLPIDASWTCTTMNICSLSPCPRIPTSFLNRLWAPTLPSAWKSGLRTAKRPQKDRTKTWKDWTSSPGLLFLRTWDRKKTGFNEPVWPVRTGLL